MRCKICQNVETRSEISGEKKKIRLNKAVKVVGLNVEVFV